MNKLPLLLSIIIIAFFTSCNSNDAENSDSKSDVLVDVKDSTSAIPVVNTNFLTVEKWSSLTSETQLFYVINYAGVSSEEQAISTVDSLKVTFPNAGYLWIPDFASLSGKELFAVYLDYTNYSFNIFEILKKARMTSPNVYAVKVSQTSERWVAYSSIDIRIDDKKQKMILTYDSDQFKEPSDEEEEEYDSGDWGFFVNDVSNYFEEHHPSVLFDFINPNEILPEELKKLKSKLDLDEGRGYVLIDGKNMIFIGHDMPQYVITEACSFFDFPAPDFGY